MHNCQATKSPGSVPPVNWNQSFYKSIINFQQIKITMEAGCTALSSRGNRVYFSSPYLHRGLAKNYTSQNSFETTGTFETATEYSVSREHIVQILDFTDLLETAQHLPHFFGKIVSFGMFGNGISLHCLFLTSVMNITLIEHNLDSWDGAEIGFRLIHLKINLKINCLTVLTESVPGKCTCS